MICNPCTKRGHKENACRYPGSCTCQHRPWVNYSALLAAAGIAALTACTNTPAAPTAPTATTESSTATTTPTTTATPPGTATVTKVVDGDTFHAQLNGADVTIRILAIDTPETVDPRRPDGCYGQEASREAHRLLDGKPVDLTPDPTQDDKDRYGRLLRYVQIDGQDYGFVMVVRGFAKAYKLKSGPAPQRYANYLTAQDAALKSHAGMWSACATSGTS